MFQFDRLKSLLPHAMSEARHGSMSFRYGSNSEVIENRLKFLGELQDLPGGYPLLMPGNGVSMRGSFVTPLEPDDEIVGADYGDRSKGMWSAEDEVRAEALVTRDRGLFLNLTIADCAAVTFFDPVTETLALAHLSRVTACYRYPPGDEHARETRIPPLLARLVDFLRELGAQPENLIIAMGPAIAQRSYELEWFDNVEEPEWRPFLTKSARGWLVNLIGFSRWLLGSKGVLADNIEVSGLDTATALLPDGSYQFFSHRRAKQNGEPEGRNAFVVGMPLGEQGVRSQ